MLSLSGNPYSYSARHRWRYQHYGRLPVDLSSWYRESLAPKIETIQTAIGDRHLIKFRYYAPSGESERTIEPYYLVFRWSSWYLWGWCLKRKDFRLFKLNRMDNVQKTGKRFECREAAMPDLSNEKIFPGGIKVKALFEPDQRELATKQSKALVRTFKKMKDYIIGSKGLIGQREVTVSGKVGNRLCLRRIL